MNKYTDKEKKMSISNVMLGLKGLILLGDIKELQRLNTATKVKPSIVHALPKINSPATRETSNKDSEAAGIALR